MASAQETESTAAVVDNKPSQEPPGPDAVAESLQEVLKQSSSAGQEAEDTKTKKRKCREEDFEDFRQRLGSFKRPSWFNKPVCFSALAAARRGWQNGGQDQLFCPVCSAELTIKFEPKRSGGCWMANGQPVEDTAGVSHEILEKSHSPFCPWRSVEVKNDPQWCSDEELAADVEKRRVGLLAMKHLPLVIEGEAPAAHPAEVLASAGWEAIGTADGRDFFRCSICLRTHIVQSFAHRATEAKEPAICPPATNLWTPKIRVMSLQSEQTGQDGKWFDPHAFHHYYCPLFCHPEEELGISAARMLKARSLTDGPSTGLPQTASAAEKAEGLVRGLNDILSKMDQIAVS